MKFTYPLYYIFFQPTNSLENGQTKGDATPLVMIRRVAQELKNKLETVLMVYPISVQMPILVGPYRVMTLEPLFLTAL